MVSDDKTLNITNAAKAVKTAAGDGADLIVLPECFNCPYGNDFFPKYAEHVPGVEGVPDANLSPTMAMLSAAAKEYKVTIVGGSVPEVVVSDGKDSYYNTCAVFDPQGTLVAKHRKIHLFDIDVPGGVRFMESDTLTAGDALTVFPSELCSIGVGICYDIRFPELARAMTAEEDVKILIYPGAFNTTTGPKHWELLQRARAVDYQVFVVTASPARLPGFPYQAWGHSSIISPWGDVIATTAENPDIVIADIDLNEVDKLRAAIPVRTQVRPDVYKI